MAAGPFSDRAGREEFTKTEALALQRALLERFEAPTFQRDLRELADAHRLESGKSKGYRVARDAFSQQERNGITIFIFFAQKRGESNIEETGIQKFTRKKGSRKEEKK